MNRVDVALGLYNGSAYLPDFLESLHNQTWKDWRLVVRDDGSTDDSVRIIRNWAEQTGRLVKFVEDDLGNLRASTNFSECFKHTDAPYVMPADQDDVWYSDKIEKALLKIQEMEKILGHNKCLAVYCDLKVVDSELATINDSFLKLQGQSNRRLPTMAQLLSQNVAPGCSMIINRELLSNALPIPQAALMHDWWLMLIARSLGDIGHIETPGLAYRQHGKNQIGAQKGGFWSMLQKSISGRSAYIQRLKNSQHQAVALSKKLPENNQFQGVLKVYANLSEYPLFIRQYIAWKHGFGKVGHIRNLAFYLMM